MIRVETYFGFTNIMGSMAPIFTRMMLILIALVVTSCSTMRIQELAKYIRDEEEYEYALAKEYLVLAARQANLYFDNGKAHYYATKGLKVLTGAKVLPEDIRLRAYRSRDRHALAHAREEVMALLKKRVQALTPIAMAQVVAKFDCWVEEQEEGWTRLTPHSCKADFERALRSVHHESAERPFGHPVSLYYKLGKTTLTERNRRVLDELMAIIHKRPRTKIHIDGYADKTGNDRINRRVSHERAMHVEDYFLRRGVPLSRMEKHWHGSHMAKGHKGVPHKKDRRTDIHLVPDHAARFDPPQDLIQDLGKAGAHPDYSHEDEDE